MKGKEKCKALKEIRRQIAQANDIEFVVSECKHQGDCLGTCPKCESELRYLEKELEMRQNLGKVVAIVGLSTGVCASLTACSPLENLNIPFLQNTTTMQLEGDIAAPEVEEELIGEVVEPVTDVEGLMVAPENTETALELPGDVPYPETDMGIFEESTGEEDDTDLEIAGAVPKAP